MTRSLASLLLLIGFVLGAGCAEEEAPLPGAPIGMKLHALDSTCSGSGATEPVAEYRVKVVSRVTGTVETLKEASFPGNASVVQISGVPEGTDVEVTILGMPADPAGAPVSFARVRDLTVLSDQPAQAETTLSRYGGFSCPESPPGLSNVLFPSVTTLPDGRIIVIGGFRKVLDGDGRWEITQASKLAIIYDPDTGEIVQAGNEMNRARGAHAAAYLPKSGLILVVGGAETMYKEQDNTCFPWYFDKTTAGTVGFTYELFDVSSRRFLQWDQEEWPDEAHELVTSARRVFPQLSVNNDGTALVTGGGQWPSCMTSTETDTDYQLAELYRPRTENYTGTFMESFGALTMKAMRSGHTAIKLADKDKRAIHLFWGGSEDNPVAEIYTEASGQVDGTFGVFTPVTFLDSKKYNIKPYFHTITALRDRQFLVVGGVQAKSSKLVVPNADDVHLLDVRDDLKVGVTKVGGLDEGRYFHTATTFDNENVVVFGGFGAVVQGDEATVFADAATDSIRYFKLGSPDALTEPGIDDVPIPRAGQIAAAAANDCMLVMGGVDQLELGLEFQQPVPLVAELYCPTIACPEQLWATTCYQE